MITYKTKEIRTKLDDISRKIMIIIIIIINLINFTSRIAKEWLLKFTALVNWKVSKYRAGTNFCD